MKVDFVNKNTPVYGNSSPKIKFDRIHFGSDLKSNDFETAVMNRDKILSELLRKEQLSFLEKFKSLFKASNFDINELEKRISRIATSHKWTNAELESLEGLQYGLKSFEGMNIKQVYFLMNNIMDRAFWMPVVRGCYHNCAHCFLDAKAPVKRMPYEDFHNIISDLSTIKSRFKIKPEKSKFEEKLDGESKYCALFHDSDGSQIVIYDKEGKEHEFPELAHEIWEKIGKKSLFDTSGWNPKSKQIQERMERLVSYYKENPDAFEDEISHINLSINPFHSMRVTALKQKEKGNIENYEKLYNTYLDMVANMLNTFAPFIVSPKLEFLCRAYSNSMSNSELNNFRLSDMKKLKKDIIKRFEENYPETVQNYPKILKDIDRRIVIEESMMKSSRQNFLKDYSINSGEKWGKLPNNADNNYIKKYVNTVACVSYIDLNGDFYFMNDYNSFRVPEIKLNLENRDTKPITPRVYPKDLYELC